MRRSPLTARERLPSWCSRPAIGQARQDHRRQEEPSSRSDRARREPKAPKSALTRGVELSGLGPRSLTR
jgi:hypothetical protein